jgi:hypothetical protein
MIAATNDREPVGSFASSSEELERALGTCCQGPRFTVEIVCVAMPRVGRTTKSSPFVGDIDRSC